MNNSEDMFFTPVENWEEKKAEKRRLYAEGEARKLRNERLLECDWTQLPNCQLSDEKKEEWETYRQKLRDLPTSGILNWHWIENFPERPE